MCFMAKWRFLTNHALVLIHVANNPRSTLRQISDAVGITERAVQTILRDMEKDALIRSEREGRRKSYRVYYKVLLSYPLAGPYRTVVELAQALTDLGRRLREGELPMDDPEDEEASEASNSDSYAPSSVSG
jgi:DNA-binding transcriptional ArsR family regulator